MPDRCPTDLDRALDRLYPAPPVDDAAVDRALRRLTAEMNADPVLDTVRRGRLTRRTAAARPIRYRRRLTAALAVAAVGAGVAVATHLGGPPSGRAPDPGTANVTLLQLAGYFRAAPAPAPGSWVRITDTNTQTEPAQVQRVLTKDGSVPVHTLPPRDDHDVDVTFRPADLADTSTPWVIQHDGGAAVSARCDGVGRTGDPCRPGEPFSPQWLATLATMPAAQVAAALQAGGGPGAPAGQHVMFTAMSWLPVCAGDPAVTAKIAEGLAVLAAQDSSIHVSRQGSDYVLSDSVAGGSEKLTVNVADGTISYYGAGEGRTFTMSIASQEVAASQVPSATPYRVATPGPSSTTPRPAGS